MAPRMDLDGLLFRYFGTTDVSEAPPNAQAAAIERIQVDFGLEKDRGNRFALWALLHLLGAAPELETAFKDPRDRDAARTLMDMLALTEDGGASPAG